MSEIIQVSARCISYCPCSEWNGWGRLGTLATLVFQAISLAARPACSALTRAYPRSLGESLCGVGALALVACAPASHEAEPPNLPAIDTPTEEPAPKTPYALFVDDSLDPSAIEAAHTRQAGRILNERLGDEVFVWNGYASFDEDAERCDTVLVTRGASDGVYLDGCRWTVELAEGGSVGDYEVVDLVRLLLVTIDGPRGES